MDAHDSWKSTISVRPRHIELEVLIVRIRELDTAFEDDLVRSARWPFSRQHSYGEKECNPIPRISFHPKFLSDEWCNSRTGEESIVRPISYYGGTQRRNMQRHEVESRRRWEALPI